MSYKRELRQKLKAAIAALQELDKALDGGNLTPELTPNQAAFRLITAAEVVATCGYQPRQVHLNRLRAAVVDCKEATRGQ